MWGLQQEFTEWSKGSLGVPGHFRGPQPLRSQCLCVEVEQAELLISPPELEGRQPYRCIVCLFGVRSVVASRLWPSSSIFHHSKQSRAGHVDEVVFFLKSPS